MLADDCANLEQAGLRGLMRVIGAEHPHLRATQIDVDERHRRRAGGAATAGAGRKRTRPPGATASGTRRACAAAPLRPEERRTTVVDHEHDGMRLQIRTPGDLQTMELVAFDRVPPGPGQIEVAVTASSINFADVLVALGRFPSIDGRHAGAGYGFRRRGHRGRARTSPTTRSVTVSAASPETAAGPRSSPVTPASPSRCRRA